MRRSQLLRPAMFVLLVSLALTASCKDVRRADPTDAAQAEMTRNDRKR